MKPVVVNPDITFTQLVEEITTVEDITATNTVLDQLISCIRRRINAAKNTSPLSPVRKSTLPSEDPRAAEEGATYQSNNNDIQQRLEI